LKKIFAFENGKSRVIWRRKVVRPEPNAVMGRQTAENVGWELNPGSLSGFFFGKWQSARHFELKEG